MKNSWCPDGCGQLQGEVVKDQDCRAKGRQAGEEEGDKELLSHSNKSFFCFAAQGPRLGPGTRQTALCNSRGDLVKRTLAEEL